MERKRYCSFNGGSRMPWRFWPELLAAGLLAVFFSLWAGAAPLAPRDIVTALLGKGEPLAQTIVWQIRLPRVALALVTGACLGTSGCAFQAVLRNPLADPYLLGVSGGGALAGVGALLLGFTSPLSLPGAAFVGTLGALALVWLVARAHSCSTTTLILSGVMVSSFASALLLLLLWNAPASLSRSALFWLGGDLSLADADLLLGGALLLLAAFAVLEALAPALDLVTLGDEASLDLGLAVGRCRLVVFVAAGALSAVAVALAGMVGFVGLAAPHAARLLLGPAHRSLLPASALCGAFFLTASDGLCRWLLAPAELPVGVVTALFGAPFFLWLMRRTQNTERL